MKLNQGNWRSPGSGEPLRQLHEIADGLGITFACLRAHIGRDNDAPKPRIRNARAAVSNRVQWYSPSEVRNWLKAKQAEKGSGK